LVHAYLPDAHTVHAVRDALVSYDERRYDVLWDGDVVHREPDLLASGLCAFRGAPIRHGFGVCVVVQPTTLTKEALDAPASLSSSRPPVLPPLTFPSVWAVTTCAGGVLALYEALEYGVHRALSHGCARLVDLAHVDPQRGASGSDFGMFTGGVNNDFRTAVRYAARRVSVPLNVGGQAVSALHVLWRSRRSDATRPALVEAMSRAVDRFLATNLACVAVSAIRPKFFVVPHIPIVVVVHSPETGALAVRIPYERAFERVRTFHRGAVLRGALRQCLLEYDVLLKLRGIYRQRNPADDDITFQNFLLSTVTTSFIHKLETKGTVAVYLCRSGPLRKEDPNHLFPLTVVRYKDGNADEDAVEPLHELIAQGDHDNNPPTNVSADVVVQDDTLLADVPFDVDQRSLLVVLDLK
jgi:hypothetical protein